MKHLASILLVLLVVAPALPGLIPAGAASHPAATHHVHINGFAFDPTPLTVATGDTVVFHNHDSASHTATADNGDWDTGPISSGESASVTFTAPGTWGYHCAFHPSMRATLVAEGEPVPPPTVAITSPEAGEAVEGTVTITGTATAHDGAAERVEVRIDEGPWQRAQGADQWSFAWDTTGAANGPATIHARALDGGQRSEVASVSVEVANPPSVDLRIGPGDIRAEPHHETTPVRVTVHNDGNVDADAFEVLLAYRYNGEERTIGTRTVPTLGAKAAITLRFDWGTLGKVGDFQVVAAADRALAVDTADPSNNAAERTVPILAPGVPGTDLLDPA